MTSCPSPRSTVLPLEANTTSAWVLPFTMRSTSWWPLRGVDPYPAAPSTCSWLSTSSTAPSSRSSWRQSGCQLISPLLRLVDWGSETTSTGNALVLAAVGSTVLSIVRGRWGWGARSGCWVSAGAGLAVSLVRPSARPMNWSPGLAAVKRARAWLLSSTSSVALALLKRQPLVLFWSRPQTLASAAQSSIRYDPGHPSCGRV